VSYIDSTLMSGERVVARARLHWITYVSALIFFLVSLLLFLAAVTVQPRQSVAALTVAGLLTFTTASAAGLRALIAAKTSEFAVTNKRVLIKLGFIRRTSVEVLLSKVEAIKVEQSIAGRILDFGSIVITGTGGSRDPYHRIAAPLEFRRAVQEQVAAVQEAR